MLKDNPEHAGALELMGTLAIEAGDPSQAERYFRRAVKFEPDHPLFLNNLGNVLCETEQFEKAIPHLERATRLAPQLSEPHCNLARVYRNLGLTDRAFTCIETARKINRDYPLSILTFAEILTDLGRPDEATRYFRQVISLGVMLPRSLVGLTEAHKFGPQDPEIDLIEKLLAGERLSNVVKSRLLHAAGKIYDDLGDYDKAFDRYAAAKKFVGWGFDLEERRRQYNDLRDIFSQSFFAERRGFGDPAAVPIFIVGMPRSGTTLTEQIVASHPAVTGAGELPLIGRLARRMGFDRSDMSEYRRQMTNMTPRQSRELAQGYIDAVRARHPDLRQIADKMPHNFEHLGLIALLFPNARIVHCRREPIDTCLSCFMRYFNKAHGYNTDLSTLGLYYREYLDLMRHWGETLPLPVHEVRYEQLVGDQEKETRSLLSFLDLPWDDRCLRILRNRPGSENTQPLAGPPTDL